MDMVSKGWNELGIVGTIYEEEDEDSSSSVPSVPSPEFTPSPSPNFNGVKSRVGSSHEPDVVICIKDSCFRLHKEVLIPRSGYLKRLLNESSKITLSPLLNITAETFSLVTDFCYGNYLAITPFNIAALRTASELLEMDVNDHSEENFVQKTEAYFCRTVVINKECASIVLQSSFALLPEAETKVEIVSRCIEALSMMVEGDGEMSCLDGFEGLSVENLQLILESGSRRLIDCHDLLYRIIDLHLKENNAEVSDEQKIRMCNYIDCSILSPSILMHAVQNPRMPLRFVVQAMFIEQLNTRRSIISAADQRTTHKEHKKTKKADPVTLGALLQRDAALRQVAQLKNVMDATNSRIQSLEKELSVMRKVLKDSENVKSRIDASRSASSRFSSENRKVERGQIGSMSSLSVRDVRNKLRAEGCNFSSEESSDGSFCVEKKEVNFGKRLMSGIKSAFRLQSSGSKKKGDCESKSSVKLESNRDDIGVDGGKEKIVIIKKDQVFHRRTRSQS